MKNYSGLEIIFDVAVLVGCFALMIYAGKAASDSIFFVNPELADTANWRPVTATVKSIDPSDHAAVYFEYVMNGKSYRGAGTAGRGIPRLGNLNVGDSITVFYYQPRPEISFSEKPENFVAENHRSARFIKIVIALLGGATLSAMYISIRAMILFRRRSE